jgi:hypothetical protein
MSLSLDAVQAIAPDQASLTAATKLRAAQKWPVLEKDDPGTVIWGECKGSGSTPYRVVVTVEDQGYSCTCPSRKFPCKHALALMWRFVERPEAFAEATRPEWVETWLGRRRGTRRAKEGNASGAKSILAAELAAKPAAVDPETEKKKAERAAKAAAKRQAAREASILGGLDELDQWIADELAEGLGTFSGRMTERCRVAAARLVDARAPGLAALVDDLPRRLFALAESARAEKAAELLGQVALLVRAYRRQDRLPGALREDVRRHVGWAPTKDDLLENPELLRVRATWRAVGVRSETRADDLVQHETWLRRAGAETPRWALLLDFVPKSAGGGAAPYHAGELLDAELVFHPSAVPLRALLAHAEPASGAPELGLAGPAPNLHDSWTKVRRTWAEEPWRDPVPFEAAGVSIGEVGGRHHLFDDAVMLPIETDSPEHLEALASAGPSTVLGLASSLGHRLLAAATPLGPWYAT